VNYRPDEWVAPTIRMSDVACRCGRDDCTHKTLDPIIHRRTLALLRRVGLLIRDYPSHVAIQSCLRCARHNAFVGGKPDSAHIHRVAIDLRPSGSARKLYDLIDGDNFAGGLFYYPNGNFVHVDLHPSDRVRRGLTGDRDIKVLGPRWGSGLDPIFDWNLDEPEPPPEYIAAAIGRETTA
jgi:hypothetical protein